jgi:hypothetical protein
MMIIPLHHQLVVLYINPAPPLQVKAFQNTDSTRM